MRARWALGGILLLSLWAYGVPSHEFVYEDRAWLSAAHDPPTLQSMRPLTHLTWYLQGQYTPSPGAYHILNRGLHGSLAVLVAWLVWRMTRSRWVAVWIMGVILLHPMLVESVTYTASRADLLAAVFTVAACLLSLTPRWWWWIPSAICAALAIAAKESALIVFLLLPVVRYFHGYAWRLSGAICAALCLAGMISAGGTSLLEIGEAPGLHVDAWTWLRLQSTAALRLVVVSMVPIGPYTVDFDYDRVPMWLGWGCVGALLAGVGAIWWNRRSRPTVACGLTWWLLCLLPRLLVQTPRSILNEHQFLLAFLGLALAAGGMGKRRKPTTSPKA
jgi:hypothetical protein